MNATDSTTYWKLALAIGFIGLILFLYWIDNDD